MLECEGVTKDYEALRAVDSLSFTVDDGEFATLLGPSGCGKSTTLHMVAGLTTPSTGRIRIRGEDVTDQPPNERNIGMVFQNTALFPHLDVRENVAYGLRMRNVPADRIERRVDDLLEMVDMAAHDSHRPTELSGGQKQRIAIARAIAFEPDLLLLDEPLTGLDRVLRENMRREIERIQREVDVTTLYVTHDQKEALSMSDKVIVMNEGEKQQEGHPEEIYTDPSAKFVAEFIGKSTTLEGEIVDASAGRVRSGDREILAGALDDRSAGDRVTAYIRPEHVEVSTQSEDWPNQFEGTVRSVENLGEYAQVDVELPDGTVILAKMAAFPSLGPGDRVFVGFDPVEVIAL